MTHPELAKEADGWDPSEVTFGSNLMRPWICSLHHRWNTTPTSRTGKDKTGCPICSGNRVLEGFNDLETTHSALALEADGWDPKKFSAGSRRKMEWKCKLDHSWSALIQARVRGDGCPYCSNRRVLPGSNDLATVNPSLALEAFGWDPRTTLAGSHSKNEWVCSEGHHWTAVVVSRLWGRGCPICSGNTVMLGINDLITTHPDLAAQAEGWDPRSYSFGSIAKKKWKCSEGHSWVAAIYSRTSGRGCPSCAITGFDPNKSGFLYILEHPNWEMFQIGITNFPDDRLGGHKKLGWELIEIRGPMDGHLIQQWETAILRMLKAKGADLSNPEIAGKFDGYSEAWSKSTFEAKSIKDLMRLTEEFEEN